MVGRARIRDDPGMGQTTDTTHDTTGTTHAPERPSADRRWRRPVAGRIVGGVAAGVARHTDIEPWLVRAVFVVTSFAGGFGVAAYLVGWALMPEEGRPLAVADDLHDRLTSPQSTSQRVGLVLMGIAGLIVLGSAGIVASPLMLAAVLVVAGIALTRPSAG
jgi:phage shock protein PspC (stress-responsive transcriptional regulator)